VEAFHPADRVRVNHWCKAGEAFFQQVRHVPVPALAMAATAASACRRCPDVRILSSPCPSSVRRNCAHDNMFMDAYRFYNERLSRDANCARLAYWARSGKFTGLTGEADDMTACLIDGKAVAAALRAPRNGGGRRPRRQPPDYPRSRGGAGGHNPASEVYVSSKKKTMVEAGMRSFDHRLAGMASEAELLALIARLNSDPAGHGILVQLPLPPQIDPHKVIAAINPDKDVDGFHPSMSAASRSACRHGRRVRRRFAVMLE
jgi:Tetrahydrofolate dehydrogenase/cyclohydrolase, catalytic domain